MRRGVNLCKIASGAYFPVMKNSPLKELRPILAPAGFCKQVKDVYSKTSPRTYLKSFCLGSNFDKGYLRVKDMGLLNGMTLAKADTTQNSAMVFEFLDEIFASTNKVYEMYVNQGSASTCTKLTFDFSAETYAKKPDNCASSIVGLYEFTNLKCK
jgi:hypothetical protein